jgi:hypothetical protein
MFGRLTTPNLPSAADEVSHWTEVKRNAVKSGDTALAERAKANIAEAQGRKAKQLATTRVIDRRGLRKTVAA